MSGLIERTRSWFIYRFTKPVKGAVRVLEADASGHALAVNMKYGTNLHASSEVWLKDGILFEVDPPECGLGWLIISAWKDWFRLEPFSADDWARELSPSDESLDLLERWA